MAAGLAPLAVGTETDGSIVSPAGVCGVVGFKPTLGSIPGAGIVPISPQQDTAGPMARTVADAAALYRVLAGLTAPVPAVELAGLRVASWRQPDAPAAVADMQARVEQLLAAAGAVVVPTEPAAGRALRAVRGRRVRGAGGRVRAALPAYLAGRPGDHPRTWPELLAFNRADEIELSRFSDEIFSSAPRRSRPAAPPSEQYQQARQACDAEREPGAGRRAGRLRVRHLADQPAGLADRVRRAGARHGCPPRRCAR